MTSRKRKQIELSAKLEIIAEYKNNKTPAQLALAFESPASTISTIVNPKNQQKILETYQNASKA